MQQSGKREEAARKLARDVPRGGNVIVFSEPTRAELRLALDALGRTDVTVSYTPNPDAAPEMVDLWTLGQAFAYQSEQDIQESIEAGAAMLRGRRP